MCRLAHPRIAIVAAAWCSLTAAAVGYSATPDHGIADAQRSVWSPHVLLVELHNLPRRYSCDELWYKFRDVLRALGARSDMNILPYRCERVAGAAAYSPKVQLEFFLPTEVSGAQARWATLRSQARDVTLEPGKPAHIDVHDCALLDQMRSTLLPALGDRVTTFHLACQAPPSGTPPFALTVQALLPLPQSPTPTANLPPASAGGTGSSGS
ncbi:MAG TPA: hypothetical protein VLX90_02160 [Steroidobacteraceae bacterium]|nr:hypothetical protein [Steroidobacteraceae bacterium]